MVKHLASWLRGCPRNTHIGDLWFRTTLPCLCSLEKALKMLDRCLQLASSPEERCVKFLFCDMSVFITCECCIAAMGFSSPSFIFCFFLTSVFLSSSSSSSYFSSLSFSSSPSLRPPSTSLSSSSSYPSPPPLPTPLLLLFLPLSSSSFLQLSWSPVSSSTPSAICPPGGGKREAL